MNKKLGIIAASSVLLMAGTIAVTSEIHPLSSMLNGVATHSNKCHWVHYDRIEPTFETEGVKEYWICCEHNEIQFEAPTSGNITDGTHPAGFKDSIMPVDERARLTPYYQRILDFDREDGCEYPFYDLSKSYKVSSVEILDGVGVNGTRGIKAQFTAGTDSGLFFKKEYLDAVFANDTIQAIEFDAKGDAHASNFRHRQASGSNICYHFNHTASMFGLTTTWTTYSFTRDMYNELKSATNYDGGFVIWGSLAGTGALYLDNIRPTKRNLANDSLSVSFDDMNSDILGLGTNDVFLLSPYTYTSSNRGENDGIIKINSENAGIESIDFSTSIKSEGSRSLHIHKKANSALYFYIKNSILDACNPYGLTFDIYITQYLNPGQLHFYRNDRSSNPENPPYVLKGSGWQTFTVPYCNTRDVTNNSFDGLFGLNGTDGKKEMDIYIDNIRPATPEDLYESFEDKGVFKFDTYYEIGGNYKINDTTNPINFPRNETWAQNLRDNDFASFWVNDPNGGLSKISVDTKHAKDGVSALKFEVQNANSPIYMFFNKVENSKMNIDDEISFDVYSECNGNISFGKANTAGRQEPVKTVSPNTWTNVTFKKGDLINGVDQFFRLNEASIGATGSFWIDNIVIKKQEVFKKPLDFERGTVTNTSGAFEYSVDGIKLMYNLTTSNFASAELTTNLPFGRKGQALKLTKNNNYVAFYLGLDFYNNIPNVGTISFDLYSTVGVNSNSVGNLLDGNNNLIGGGDYQHPANQWTTYTFSKSNLGSDGRFLIIQGGTAGDFYFDNFRINKNVEDLHENSGTFYLSPDEHLTIDFGTMNQGLEELYLDNELLGTSKYSISNGKVTFELDAISNGEHKLSFKALTGDYCYNNIEHYFGIYRASTSSSLNASLTYGSSAYQTLSGYGDVNKVVCNGKSIAFERSGSNILVPDAALIECLPTTNNQKSSGNVKLFVISGDKNSSVKELNVAISMTSANVKTGYTGSTNKTFGTFGYSSTSGGNNNNVLNDIDHMMEYQRSGLESVYEQLYAIPVNLADNYFTEPQVSNWITRDFNNCEELGMSYLVQDEFVIKMCKETSSIYNRDINVGTDSKPITVHFANSSELDAYVLNRLTKYAMLPALRKIVLCDEPRYNNLAQVGELYNSVRRGLNALNRQDVVINVNLLPISAGVDEDDGLGPEQRDGWFDSALEKRVLTYKNYLNVFYSYANSPELTYDIYPLTSGGVNQYSYLNLEIAAQYARDNNKKLTVVTESFANPKYDSNTNTRIMSRDDIHYLNNMLMGFGVEEISYFTYYSRDNSSEFLADGSGSFVRELFDNDNKIIGTERMGLWYNMQTMLEEMKEFDSVILNFDFVSCKIDKASRTTNNNQNTAYSNADEFDDTNSYSSFGDMTGLSLSSDYWMSTYLKDSNNKYMHMIQNVTDPQYHASSESYQTVTLTFKSGFSYAVIYENGTPRIVNLSSNKLTLQLSSGNAAFVLVY